MTRGEAVNWLINIMADIGKAEHRDLWHYEQALCEIRDMLEYALDTNVDTISWQAAIDTEGLDEQIRCEMCRNPMHTDRGCDGNCKYDEKLYGRIMQILGERIKPLPPAQPKRCSDCIAHGGDWECDHMHCRKGRLPSAQSEQKYTNKELRVFMHGISMRLLSLRSAQHWKYDDETAEEIKFLEQLYKKVESEVTQ